VGFAFLFLAALGLALMSFLIKLSGGALTVWQIGFGRALFGILSMLGLSLAFKVSLDGPERRILLLRGATGTAGFLSFVYAVHHLPLAQATLLFYLFPVFAAIVSPLINKERTVRREWLCIGIAFAGTILVLGPGAVSLGLGRGHLFACLAAFFGGLNISFVRRLSAGHSAYSIYFYFSLVAAVVSAGPALAGEGGGWPGLAGLGLVLIIGLAATVGQLSMNYGFFHLSAPEGGVILMSQVPLAAMLGWIFFDEGIGWLFVAGAVLILAGGLGLTLKTGSPEPVPD